MFEKFNITDTDAAGGGGEYTVQVGFGWTNGVGESPHSFNHSMSRDLQVWRDSVEKDADFVGTRPLSGCGLCRGYLADRDPVLWLANEFGSYLPMPTCPLIPIIETTANGNSSVYQNGTSVPYSSSGNGSTNTTMANQAVLFQGYRVPRN
jgi:alpha,alpha-trehalase